MAHVVIVLDPRLCLSSTCHAAPRSMVAQSRAGLRDAPLRALAQGQRALPAVGLLSRGAPGFASSDPASTAQGRLGPSCPHMDSGLVARNDGAHQFWMGILSRHFPTSSAANANGTG